MRTVTERPQARGEVQVRQRRSRKPRANTWNHTSPTQPISGRRFFCWATVRRGPELGCSGNPAGGGLHAAVKAAAQQPDLTTLAGAARYGAPRTLYGVQRMDGELPRSRGASVVFHRRWRCVSLRSPATERTRTSPDCQLWAGRTSALPVRGRAMGSVAGGPDSSVVLRPP